jgi:hypothetical protein
MGNTCSYKTIVDDQYIKMQYDDLDMRPLDLILVYGGKNKISSLVSCCEKETIGDGNWTHCGLVITPDIIPISNSVAGKKYIWESNMSASDEPEDVETNQQSYNVQVRDFEEYLQYARKNKGMRVAICRLNSNPLIKSKDESAMIYNARVKVVKDILEMFHYKTHNTPYDIIGFTEPVWSYWTGGKCNCLCDIADRNDGAFICSAFVGRVYQLLGLINENLQVDTLFPCSFLTDTRLQRLNLSVPIIIL